MTLDAFLPTDDPAVTTAPAPGRDCGRCRHFSQWIGTSGDCMLWAHRRREISIRANDPSEIPEMKSARMTEASEGCAGWEAREA